MSGWWKFILVCYQNPPAFKIHLIKIHLSQNPTDRNLPIKIHHSKNQPEWKTTKLKSIRVETNTLLYLFIFQSKIIQMNLPPQITNLEQISFVETTDTHKIFSSVPYKFFFKLCNYIFLLISLIVLLTEFKLVKL